MQGFDSLTVLRLGRLHLCDVVRHFLFVLGAQSIHGLSVLHFKGFGLGSRIRLGLLLELGAQTLKSFAVLRLEFLGLCSSIRLVLLH